MANVGIYDMTDTWNNAGTSFTAIKMNVTDTASASGSKLLDIQIGGSSYLELNKSGELGILDKIFHLGDTNTAIRFPAADTVTVETAGSERMRIDSSGNVGIGTTTPTSINGATENSTKLNITNTSLNTTLNVEGTSGARIFLTSTNSTANKRIYELNSGADNFTISQIDDAIAVRTERMRITSDGYLRMASGSGGIQFNGDTAAANALDDYEEGTWTPTYGGSVSDPTCTHDTQNGKYTKIGNIVHVSCGIGTDAASGGSGDLRINGLPFTSAADSWASSSNGVNYDFSSAVNPNAYISSSTNFIIFVTDDNTAGVTSVSVLQNGTNDNRLFFSITYTAA